MKSLDSFSIESYNGDCMEISLTQPKQEKKTERGNVSDVSFRTYLLLLFILSVAAPQ